MDLGATLCTPKRPSCSRCPWKKNCRAFSLGIEESLPRKAPRRVRPLRRGAAFVARDRNGAILLVKRPEKGLLGGMLQPPLGPWSASFPRRSDALKQAPFRAEWRRRPGVVSHGFTHFELELEVWRAEVRGRSGSIEMWLAPDALATAALPTVMRKIIAHAFAAEDRPTSL
jgi:A/G-specific adenine glycosylase